MDLKLVEIFCEVYEARSFSRAAEKLRLRQPTISSHIRTLEGQLGTALFERRGREVHPTRAADLLYEHGRQIAQIKKSAARGIDRLLHRFEGDLEIGGSTIPGEYILPEIMAAYRVKYPGVRVRLRIADTRRMLEALEEGAVDLAFVGAKSDSRHLRFRRFVGDELVLVARAGSPWARPRGIACKNLPGLPFIMREAGSGTRTTLEMQLRRHGVDPAGLNVIAEIGSSNGVKEAVKAGIGVTILSSRAVTLELETGRLRRIPLRDCRRMERDFQLATDRRRTPSLLAESFLKFALAAIPPRATSSRRLP